MSAKGAVSVATLYLIVYTALATSGYSYPSVAALYLISPLVVITTVYLVLKDNQNAYPELSEDEEWGYRDKAKNSLGVF